MSWHNLLALDSCCNLYLRLHFQRFLNYCNVLLSFGPLCHLPPTIFSCCILVPQKEDEKILQSEKKIFWLPARQQENLLVRWNLLSYPTPSKRFSCGISLRPKDFLAVGQENLVAFWLDSKKIFWRRGLYLKINLKKK